MEQVEQRLANPEPRQQIDEARLWSDLLASMPMCFNLFGELAADISGADQAMKTWWPDIQGSVEEVRFEWSPGRRVKGSYLEDQTAFDVAFLLRMSSGGRGVIGIETKYHEDIRREQERANPRYGEVAAKAAEAGVFGSRWQTAGLSTDLQQIWRDHLLALSMLQQAEGGWEFARYVVVSPSSNPSVADAVERYREQLMDDSTFDARTVHQLLVTEVLPRPVQAVFASRYLL